MKHPLLYQLNTRVLLQERGAMLGRQATLDDVPDEYLEAIAARGFDYVWLLGIWQTGEAGCRISRSQPELRAACLHSLPDMTEADICGSPFAIQSYTVHRDFGGDEALVRLRKRLTKLNLRLILDFVPNHMAPDHPWVSTHPEYFIEGTEEDLAREPKNYVRVPAGTGEKILAYGRDPYFSGWPDTLQLNYRHPRLRKAMQAELSQVADRCDGVRCDMAMLVQPEVFQRTWGDRARPRDGTAPADSPFWSDTIKFVKRRHPDFLFIAEVYWDMEWELQNEGFDFTYDKRLYDRLLAGAGRSVREHLMAHTEFQEHSLRFLENHDEPRAAATFGEKLKPAALITFLVPGMRFFYEGQFEGRKTHVSMHIGRRPNEALDIGLRAFYEDLLQTLQRPEVHLGEWRLWDCRPAWENNSTWEQFVVFSWQHQERRLLAAVNYGPVQGQCYVSLSLPGIRGQKFTMVDLLSDARYERDGDGLAGNGLYLDLPAWGYNLFELQEHTQQGEEFEGTYSRKRAMSAVAAG